VIAWRCPGTLHGLCASVWRLLGLATLLFCGLLGLGPAHASDATLWLASGVDADRAREAATLLGHVDVAIRPVGELAHAVQVVGVVDRRIEDLCGGPVDVEAWRGRLSSGREQLQLLDLNGALSTFARLQAELPCLTGLLAPGDVFRFHLSSAEVDLVVARSESSSEDMADFYRREARAAAARAAASAPYGRPPDDTLVEARQLLTSVRAAQSNQRPARVVVAGPHERVWWDGTPADRVPFDVPPGTHVFQLTDGSRKVVAVQVAVLGPGDAAVVWARPDATPLSTDDIQAAVRTLAQTGRAPIGLAQSLRALSLDGPSYIVTGDEHGVALWGADGDMVRLKLVDPPVSASGQSRKATQAASSSPGLDGAFVLGPSLGIELPGAAPLLGILVGGRVGVARSAVLTISVDSAARDLPGSTGWPATGRVSVVAGARYRLPARWWDVGVEGGFAASVGHGLGDTRPVPVLGAVSSLRLPAQTLVGVRLSGRAAWQPGGVVAGGAVLLDLGN